MNDVALGLLLGPVTATAEPRELGDRPAIARATAAMGQALLSAYRTPDALAVLEPAFDEF